MVADSSYLVVVVFVQAMTIVLASDVLHWWVSALQACCSGQVLVMVLVKVKGMVTGHMTQELAWQFPLLLLVAKW